MEKQRPGGVFTRELPSVLVGPAVGQVVWGVALSAAEAISRINGRYALVRMEEETLHLRRMALCNDLYDRSFERFPEEFLEKLAATLQGKAVLAHHDTRQFPIGRFYNTYLERDAAGVTWLMAQWYATKEPEVDAVVRQLDAGIYAYVSIGFRGGDLYCDVCGSKWSFWSDDCPHWPGERYPKPGSGTGSAPPHPPTEHVLCTLTWADPENDAEAVEGSLVWLGCQIGARNVKRAGEWLARKEGRVECNDCKSRAQALRVKEEDLRGAEERSNQAAVELATLKTQVKELERSIAGHVKSAESFQTVISGLQDETKSLKAEVESLKPLAADGELYRADLVEDVKRLGGIVGAEREATTIAAALLPAGAPALKEQREEYRKRVDRAFPVSPVGEAALPEESSERAVATYPSRAGENRVI